MYDQNVPTKLPPFDLLVEVAPIDGCFAHIPALPGLCYRAYDPEGAMRIAQDQIANYLKWLLEKELSDLNPKVFTLASWVNSQNFAGVRVIERERRDGAPLWISGNPTVLFEYDHQPLDDTAVRAHLRFVCQIVKSIRAKVDVMHPDHRGRKPTPQIRSIDETLTHIGNCVWWYCSRIDNELPEPIESADETPMARIERLLEAAKKNLLAIPNQSRTTVHIPTRMLTKDPQEAWTHTKVCRRQAEHMWEHLQTLDEEIGTAA